MKNLKPMTYEYSEIDAVGFFRPITQQIERFLFQYLKIDSIPNVPMHLIKVDIGSFDNKLNVLVVPDPNFAQTGSFIDTYTHDMNQYIDLVLNISECMRYKPVGTKTLVFSENMNFGGIENHPNTYGDQYNAIEKMFFGPHFRKKLSTIYENCDVDINYIVSLYTLVFITFSTYGTVEKFQSKTDICDAIENALEYLFNELL